MSWNLVILFNLLSLLLYLWFLNLWIWWDWGQVIKVCSPGFDVWGQLVYGCRAQHILLCKKKKNPLGCFRDSFVWGFSVDEVKFHHQSRCLSIRGLCVKVLPCFLCNHNACNRRCFEDLKYNCSKLGGIIMKDCTWVVISWWSGLVMDAVFR